jgi:large subunit ribosomal protein L9e
MKPISTSQAVNIPENVTVNVEGRKVTVTGPRGTLSDDFSHVAVEITRLGKNKLRVSVWHGARKHIACIRTVCTHIMNMIKGVTLGFQYKMRAAYSHFPINISITDKSKAIEIRNYLGEKLVRRIVMPDGVTIDITDQKDEIVLRGNSKEDVSQTAAKIQQSTACKNKDIRKFLDGIYVSERATVVKVSN